MALHVDKLRAAQLNGGTVDVTTSEWLSKISDKLYGWLAKIGLVTPHETTSATLGDLMDRSFATMAAKRPFKDVYKQIRRSLEGYFVADWHLRWITTSNADLFKVWLKTKSNRKHKDRMISRTRRSRGGMLLTRESVAHQVAHSLVIVGHSEPSPGSELAENNAKITTTIQKYELMDAAGFEPA